MMCDFRGCECRRNDADDFAARGERRISDRAHQPDASAAVDDAVARSDRGARGLCRDVAKAIAIPRMRAAKNAQPSHERTPWR